MYRYALVMCTSHPCPNYSSNSLAVNSRYTSDL